MKLMKSWGVSYCKAVSTTHESSSLLYTFRNMDVFDSNFNTHGQRSLWINYAQEEIVSMNLPSLQQAIKCTFIGLDIDNTYYLEWQYGNCQIVKWQKCRDNKHQGAVNAMGKGDCHF